jgi:hypothetical protein
MLGDFIYDCSCNPEQLFSANNNIPSSDRKDIRSISKTLDTVVWVEKMRFAIVFQ